MLLEAGLRLGTESESFLNYGYNAELYTHLQSLYTGYYPNEKALKCKPSPVSNMQCIIQCIYPGACTRTAGQDHVQAMLAESAASSV